MFDQKVLIIDGHPVYILKIDGFLKGLTLKNISLAKTGKEGIEKLQSEQPQVVIMSGMLPDIEAHEVCQTARMICPPSTKIIVQIGLFTDQNDIDRFRQNGADVILDRKEKDLAPLEEAVTAAIS